jgi:N-acetylglucosamine-6-phosphate deacetylase
MQAFTARRLLTPHEVVEHPVMVVEDGRVARIASRPDFQLPPDASRVDFGEGVIVPGFVDLHIHGSAGYDVMDEYAEALPAIERFLARHGVTSYLPTTVSAPMESTLRALERLADAIEKHERTGKGHEAGAVPIGIHLEGPFLSHVRRGVHLAQDLLPPKIETFQRFWRAARGHIRMLTIAPELEGATELIGAANAKGVCVSLGHSDADFASTERAIAAGARHATHLFNGMRPMGHRDPGIAGVVLTDGRVSVDIIVDGIHLDPAIVKLVAQATGPEKLVLITDATAAAGMPDGRYRLGTIEVEVKNGSCTYDGKLAGSVLTMDAAVRSLSRFAGWHLDKAVAAGSRNAAQVIREEKGVLRVGGDADFVVLSERGEVMATFVGGRACHN